MKKPVIASIFLFALVMVFSGRGYGALPVTTDLVLHLDAADVTTTTVNQEEVVTSWNDQYPAMSGDHDAVQSSPDLMPRWLDGSVVSGDLPVIYFDGDDDVLNISHHNDLNPGTSGLTVFVVGMVEDEYVRFWLRKGNITSSVEGYSIWTDDHERVIVRCNADGVNDDAHKAGRTKDQRLAGNISVYHSLTTVTMTIGTGDDSQIYGYVNGIGTGWTTWYGGSYTGTIDNSNPLTIGTSLRGYLAEVIVYKGVLSSSDRQAVVNYLAIKYGQDTYEYDLLTEYWNAEDKAGYLANYDQWTLDLIAEGRQNGLLDSRAVVIPDSGDWLRPGWPVAMQSGNSMCLFYRRNDMRRSIDGGETWADAIDMDAFITTPNTNPVQGGMQAVGVVSSGDMLLVDGVNDYGVFRSNDGGVSWQHYPGAFTSSQLAGPALNNGPNIIEHPYWGLAVFPVSIDDTFWIRHSSDGGVTWQQSSSGLPASFAKSAESAAVNYNDAIILLGRCHSSEAYEASPGDPDLGTYRYVQLWSSNGQFPYQAALTNIRATGTSYGAGMWGQDTTALDINPVTGRLEAVVTNRNGGGPGEEFNLDIQTLNLYSIDPDELLNGSAQWRFEGTLLRRNKFQGDLEVEGMHPAAAVIDVDNGVQHIFVYQGIRNLVYGVYHLKRSLNTPLLSTFLEYGTLVCQQNQGYYLTPDINQDCVVDIRDLLLFTEGWLDCYDATMPECQ